MGLMADGGVVRVSSVVRLLVQRGRVIRILVDSTALVLLGQEFFDLPVMLLDADRKLEIFARD
jgi:hypothetical protein